MKRLLLVASVACVILLATAAPAAAHAELVRTEPGASSTVDEAPEQVTLTFSEPVSVGAGGAVRIFDEEGERVDAPAATGDGATLTVPLPDLEDGTYAVTWRVVSEDSHPIHGAFTFHLGAGGRAADAEELARRLASDDRGNEAVGIAFGVSRFVGFIASALVIGGLAFLAFVWPAGWSSPRVGRVLCSALVVGGLTTVASIGLQGAYGAGLGLTSAVDPDVWSPVLSTRFGLAALVRLVLLAAIGGFVAWRSRRLEPAASMGDAVASAVLALGVAATIGASGHAAAGDLAGLASLADTLHVAAIGFWLGGLVLLALVLLVREVDGNEGAVERFSTLALVAVGVIVVTGSFQTWRQVGSLTALTSTTYGRLLTAKLAVFVGLVGLAWLSRAWLRRRRLGEPLTLLRLRRSVGGEVALAVVVLVVTSVLVNTVPARVAVARPASLQVHTDELLIDATVDPAKRGPADVHIYTLTHDGAVADVQDVSATFSLASPAVGPLEVPLHKAGPGHFSASGFELPLPGDWELEVTATINDISQTTGSGEVEVR